MSLSLLAALVSLALWITLGFVIGVASGAVHVLLPISVGLLIHWWALRHD